ncbi:MAG TPA: universal stress protein [Verrucomicrobiae bacterium]|nr:universal stress protein [Verrucomicrobiae bacterium]
MYKKILITLDNSPADESILPHAAELAVRFGAEILLLHVADGFAARCFDQLKLAESEEIKADREYLEKTAKHLRAKELSVTTKLAMGNPPAEILKTAESEHCDLIAMAGHGHRLFGDIFHGSTITEVRHQTSIPLLVIRAKKK